jgi:NosR/NirI family nitrous oxide reductase transcriptional regulator
MQSSRITKAFGLCAWLLMLLVLMQAAPSDANDAVMAPRYVESERVDGLPLRGLFPKLTRVGDKQSKPPVYPIYQLDELIGYAWLSDEINDLPGFAGKPIKLLIGLKPNGEFQDVAVIDHHEPVFLHGLGNESLHQFLAQYKGRSVKDQIIVGSAQNDSLSKSDNSTVIFDGVTKATVSVIIINDVVLTTALQVARAKLDGFALPTQTRLIDRPLEVQTPEQLSKAGLIQTWTISQEGAESALGRSLDQFPELDGELHSEAPFTQVKIAYLNAKQVGANLLGEARFSEWLATLPDGDHLIWIASKGLYPHASDDYTPATVPARISLEQAGLSMEIRDINSPDLADALRETSNLDDEWVSHIFRIKGSAGFDPGTEWYLTLHANLARNHLVHDTASFKTTYQLPSSEWETQTREATEKPLPLWAKLWIDRWLSIAILGLGLVILLAMFIRQDRWSRSPHFHRFRWAYLFFTLFFIGFYAQGQLSVVNIYTLLHALVDGFDITLFLLDPVIFILWCVTFVSLFIWGRGLFCGWLCPFGALQEMASWLGKKLKVKQIRISDAWHRRLIHIKYPILIGLVGISFYSLTWAEKLAEVEPFKTSITLVFDRTWPFVLYAVLLLVVGMFIHKFYCRYLCPLGAGLAVIGLFRRFEWLKRIEFCGTPCQTCHRRCEIKAIKRDGEIDYNECIQCLECIVILHDETQCADKLIKAKKAKQTDSNRIPTVQTYKP